MTIGVLCLSTGHGGLELYALREIRALRQRGLSCVAIVAHNTMLSDRLVADGIPVEYLTILNKHIPVIAALRLRKLIEKHNITVMHFHWTADLNLAVLAKVFSGNKIKVVQSRHMQITRSKHDILHKWFYSRIDKLLVITRGVYEEACRFLPITRDKIRLLYLGVAEPALMKNICAEFFGGQGVLPKALNIAVFGRVEREKGQHVIVDAVRILKNKNIEVSLSLIGHIMDKDYAEQLNANIKKEKLEENIKFISFLSEPARIMPCYDVIVLTTYRETFGLVLVEAMRAGVAVIGSDAGGVQEIIDHEKTGMRFQPGNANDLATCIERLFKDRNLLATLAANGKVKADRDFSEQKHFDMLVEELSF